MSLVDHVANANAYLHNLDVYNNNNNYHQSSRLLLASFYCMFPG